MLKRNAYIFFFLFIATVNFAQTFNNTVSITDTFKVTLENKYKLSGNNILPGSEVLHLGNRTLSTNEYKLNYSNISVTLSDTLSYSIFDTLTVQYRYILTGLKSVYFKNELQYKVDEETGDTLLTLRSNTNEFSNKSIFGKGVMTSGTLVRGFSVGTNQDFTVKSGLRLQMSGKLADNIEVVAALTDENTPIQPEGNTETLEELDKVFIEIRHPNVVGTFGDYEFVGNVGEFGKITRKLQGLKGSFNYSDYNTTVAVAGSRGKFNSQEFAGDDGVQGPYRLSGVDSERDIIVIAGTERVYLDGEQMKRGENNDYTIEYGNAQITFTPKRLITSASVITVDFEYTDRRYSRSFMGGSAGTKFFDGRLKVSLGYYREGDDEKNPIDLYLSDSDMEILKNAGDDAENAYKSGINLAVIDSTGRRNGIYEQRDTVINSESYTYYLYNPGDENSIYILDFTYFGEGEGDYKKNTINDYYFVGPGEGAYRAVTRVPLPELKQTGNILIEAEPLKDVLISLETAGSSYDRNNFSTLDDDDNTGFAGNFILTVKPQKINVLGAGLGKAGINYRERRIDERYTSIDRLNGVDFNKQYNTSGEEDSGETLRELGLKLEPHKGINLNVDYGYLKQGDYFTSNRFVTDNKVKLDSSVTGAYKLEYVKTENLESEGIFNRQNGNIAYTYGILTPKVTYYFEEKHQKSILGDTLLASSYRYKEYAPGVSILDLYGFDITGSYGVREEYFPLNGIFVKESNALTQNFSAQFNKMRDFSTEFSLTIRDKKITDEFKAKGRLDNESILIKSVTKGNALKRFLQAELFYEVSTQRSSKLERRFLRVEEGQGNYIYLGDLNDNGVADEEEFEQTSYEGDFIQTTVPSDELFPVIDLQANTRWKLDFSKIVSGRGFFNTLIKNTDTETSWRIEEKSTESETAKIYLFNFSRFLNDSTTINGFNQFKQDINLFKRSRELSFRFRYSQNRSLNNYSSGVERGFYNEKSIRIKFKLVKEIANQTEYTNTNDNMAAPVRLNRSRDAETDEISSDFSYRPVNSIETGFKFRVARSTDSYPDIPTIIDVNSLLLRLNFSFSGKGRLRVEAERTELTTNNSENPIPYELLKGNQLGKNYYVRVNFDYRLASNLQTSLNYNGRKLGGNKIIHTLKAEAKAYF